jgi:hypothetical protein
MRPAHDRPSVGKDSVVPKLWFPSGIALVLSAVSCASRPHAAAPAPPAGKPPTSAGYSFDIVTPPADAVEVAPGLFADVSFGAWDAALGQRRPGRPAETIAAGSGQTFGLTALFFPANEFAGGTVRYRETLTVPSAPPSWPDFGAKLPEPVREHTHVSADGRSFTTEQTVEWKPRQLVPTYVDGTDQRRLLFPFPAHEWTAGPDAAPGQWTLRAWINDKPVASATFRVLAPAPSPIASAPGEAKASAE